MNRAGKKPEKLHLGEKEISPKEENSFLNMVGQEDIDRFNKPNTKSRKKKRRNPGQNTSQNQNWKRNTQKK